MTPVERAARAMYDVVSPDWAWDDPDAELLRRMYRANARAALGALREASAGMRQAGGEHLGGAQASAESLWVVMLDAALAEGD